MSVFVNGDSHSAGAEIIEDYCFAEDDPNYKNLGRQAHPGAVPLTYGFKLGQALKIEMFFIEAESASSNARILRTTQKHINLLVPWLENKSSEQREEEVIIVGWSSWEREEWKDASDNYVQVTASGTDSVPEEFGDRYKQWIIDQTPAVIKEKCEHWHDQIWNLHQQLVNEDIRHIFFNSYNHFDVEDQRDWGNNYVNPYEQSGTYYHWLQEQGFKTVRPDSQHYGADGHAAWSKFLLPWLTSKESSSIITNTVNPA